ncbi:MAG: sialate O-acetylesterase [Defluviitaleaceae bacterium]|nr:sialate O-acetylesterase [Defluviitaleaceae bacterium]
MIKLPAIFSDGMVLAKSANVWGFTKPNTPVRANFLGENHEAVSDGEGRFNFTFKSKDFGGPHILKIEDRTIKDVFIGRVWFCGGQSNMEGGINRTRIAFGEHVVDDERIRIFQAEKDVNFHEAQKDVKGKWNTASGDFLDHMYAAPYFFARKLFTNKKLDDGVKIGLVCNPAGGTAIESWLPEEIIKKEFPEFLPDLQQVQAEGYVQKATEEAENNKQKWLTALNEKDLGLAEKWFNPTYDDSEWERRALLDNTNFPEHGSVWFRKKFTLNKTNKTAPVLNFGRIEDSVTVYINGVEIAHIPYQYPPCTVVLPINLLTVGINTIVVRIVGETQNPTIVPGKEYYLVHAEGKTDFTDLGEEWAYRIGTKMPACPQGVWFYSRPCGVYNFMLAPLLGYSVEGLLWYQGESNTYNPSTYEKIFTRFTKLIRENFGKNLPIIFTQLANYIDPGSLGELSINEKIPGRRWAELREQQRQCLKIPNTAMAVIIDSGEYNDLHPINKKAVGERLALHALRMVYGEEIISDGPTFQKAEYKNNRLTIHFTNAQNLWAKNGHPQIDVLDKTAQSRIIYASIENNTLVAHLEEKPKKIRFGWTDCPSVTLYNAQNLPASPFEEEV